MKTLLIVLLLGSFCFLHSQNPTPQDFGFRHFQIEFNKDTVDILVKSEAGAELEPKPLLLFCQGSLPKPLIILGDAGMFGVFPFDPELLTHDYHLAIIGKPSVPLIVQDSLLEKNFTYNDESGRYSEKNHLEYYVERNIKAIKYLLKQNWVSKTNTVVAGHSEGSTVAAKMALQYPKISHLVYSSGNPMGRMLSIIGQSRSVESDTDSTRYGEFEFDYWQSIANNPLQLDATRGDSPKTTYGFSIPPIEYLLELSIPVYVCYGTKDWSSPFNDFLRVEMIRKKKTNFTFKAWVGCEHNFFPLHDDGRINYEFFNWDQVAKEWLDWLKEK